MRQALATGVWSRNHDFDFTYNARSVLFCVVFCMCAYCCGVLCVVSIFIVGGIQEEVLRRGGGYKSAPHTPLFFFLVLGALLTTSPIMRSGASSFSGVNFLSGAFAIGAALGAVQMINVSLSASCRQDSCIEYSSHSVRGSDAVSFWSSCYTGYIYACNWLGTNLRR